MKGQRFDKIIFIFLLFLFPAYLFAQPPSPEEKKITGLWKGSLYNDTTKEYLPYEIAISEDEGKLNGYSYTLFDIDGKKEMGVKKIKLKRKDDQLTIEDVELISNTYSEPPPRKVRVLSVVYISLKDTTMRLTGKWSTNRTREYLPLTGTLQLERTFDYRPMILFKILTALKLDNGLSFVKAENIRGTEIAVIKKPAIENKPIVTAATISPDPDKPKEIAAATPGKKQETAVENKPAINTSVEPVAKPPVANKPEETISPVPEKELSKLAIGELALIKNKSSGELFKTTRDKRTMIMPLTAKKREVFVSPRDIRKENYLIAINKPVTITPPPLTKKTEPVAVKEPAKKENKPIAETVQKSVAVEKPKATAPVINNKPAPVITIKEPLKTENKTPASIATPSEQKKELPLVTAAANVSERKMKNENSVFFESDSLVLTLYDNGEVDGDTVSVLMNGQIIFARTGLTTKANSKTIYIDKGMPDTLSMVMYAENLGSIPPNTGLLIIMDGEKRHEVRFSADLKTNAAILLRRRKKEN